MAPPELAGPATTGPPGRPIADVPATRKAVYTGVLDSFKGLEPIQAGNYTLTLSKLDYEDPEEVRLKDKKKPSSVATRCRGGSAER